MPFSVWFVSSVVPFPPSFFLRLQSLLRINSWPFSVVSVSVVDLRNSF